MTTLQPHPAAQALPEESRNRLVTDYLGLVWMVARRIPVSRRRGLETEEIAAEGMLGLVTAACIYDPTRGCRFSTFAVVCITNAIRSYLRFERRRSPATLVRLDWDVAGPPTAEPNDDANWLPAALNALSPSDRALIRERFGIGVPEVSYDELGRRLGISREGARKRLQRAVERLRLMRASQQRERLPPAP